MVFKRGIRWPFAVAFVGACFLHGNLGTLRVVGPSMEPALEPGETLLYTKVSPSSLAEGEIVVLKHPRTDALMIKRIYRVQGGEVDPFLAPDYYPGRDKLANYHVPEGYVYVLGDNVFESEDSRMFGPVPVEEVVGRIIGR